MKGNTLSNNGQCTVIAYIRPKPGAEERLLSLRPIMLEEFQVNHVGFISGSLYKVDDSDEWRDVVVFRDKSGLVPTTEGAAYKEWSTLVEFIKYEILAPI